MVITHQIIEAGKSVNGGWNLQQVELLGFNGWENKWKRRAIGKDLPEENIKHFLNLKDAHITGGLPKSKKDLQFVPVFEKLTREQQYRHPNWQKMRLLVLKRDNYKCVNCGHKHKTLHGHHLKYLAGKFLWEVPIWYIVTLCEDCHSEEHNRDLRLK